LVAAAVVLPVFTPEAKAAAPDARRVIAPVAVKHVAARTPIKLIFGHKLH
jgi:hypothetical protein